MDIIADFFSTTLSFLVIISVIVFIHEFGHYLFARLCGVTVEVFSVGFGKEVFGFHDRAGTRWKFSALPLGGYVKMYGDESAASTANVEKLEKMDETERSRSFHYKSLWQKSLIVMGGPLFNFLLTIAIFTGLIFMNGVTSTEPVVGEVMPGSAAEIAGLQPGDRILLINNTEIEEFRDISVTIATNLGEPVSLRLERAGQPLERVITPQIVQVEDALGNMAEVPRIGIRSQELTVREMGLIGALGHAVERTYQLCVSTLEVLKQLVLGQRSADQLKGPIGIAHMSGQAANAGIIMTLWFMALISANLGLVNLLPIPLLDGGHLLFYAVEGASGRPMAQKVQQFGFKLGFVLLVSLMAFTIFNDLRNLL
jgi:regulator of sigma E protease